ncbi:MAG: hypothetical protein LBS09_07115 [Bacteroidales bacterium]|nr:hypothetical protein [Bacteroidales bacterium]
MEMKVESRIGQLRQDDKKIFSFIADCSNFRPLATSEMIEEWQSDSDSFSFSMEQLGNLSFRIVERDPHKLIKFSIEHPQADNIFLWVQLKGIDADNARIKLTAKLNVNPMIRLLISKPLKQALDKIVDTLEHLTINE